MSEKHFSQMTPAILDKYQISPIPTSYHGILYRSRIEARWAVFFETLGLEFEYEKEGYKLGGDVLYLPDFWLPALSAWFEVKGQEVDEAEAEKAHRLAVASGHRVYAFWQPHKLPDDSGGPTVGSVFYPDGGSDYGQLWCECIQCGAVGIEYEGRTDRLPCKECCCITAGCGKRCAHAGQCRRSGHGDKGRNATSPRLVAAFTAARNVRFGR